MSKDLRHEPRLGEGSWGVSEPLVYTINGPHEHDETSCYICSLCGVIYEDDSKNVCAAKLYSQLPDPIVTRP